LADTKIVAVCGKGGVGKTSISALMVRKLSESHLLKILAIDADPAVGLALSLGVPVRKTVDDIRKRLIAKIQKGDAAGNRETLELLDYEVFDALEERDGYALLAIGRPEDEGCFCRVNNLLKDIIADLAHKFDIVLIDGEAGIEQINRRVMKTVDHLVLVSDTSAKGIGVANAIAMVAKDKKAVDYKSVGLVLNRVRSETEARDIGARTNLEIYGWLSDDEAVRDLDFRGVPLSSIPGTSPNMVTISDILKKMSLVA